MHAAHLQALLQAEGGLQVAPTGALGAAKVLGSHSRVTCMQRTCRHCCRRSAASKSPPCEASEAAAPSGAATGGAACGAASARSTSTTEFTRPSCERSAPASTPPGLSTAVDSQACTCFTP